MSMAWVIFWKKGRLEKNRVYLRCLLPAISFPFLANTFGWVMTEVGRQPWTVFGLMTTADSVSPNVSPGTVLLSIIMYVLIFTILACVMVCYFFITKKQEGLAFTMSGMGIIFTVSSIFIGMFPRVMISSINKAFDLTVYNASSGAYSLKIMTIVVVTILPFVLGYTIWSYYIFRNRVADKKNLIY